MKKLTTTAKGHLTTHGAKKVAKAHTRRKGQRFTVHGTSHVRLMKLKKPGQAGTLLGPA